MADSGQEGPSQSGTPPEADTVSIVSSFYRRRRHQNDLNLQPGSSSFRPSSWTNLGYPPDWRSETTRDYARSTSYSFESRPSVGSSGASSIFSRSHVFSDSASTTASSRTPATSYYSGASLRSIGKPMRVIQSSAGQGSSSSPGSSRQGAGGSSSSDPPLLFVYPDSGRPLSPPQAVSVLAGYLAQNMQRFLDGQGTIDIVAITNKTTQALNEFSGSQVMADISAAPGTINLQNSRDLCRILSLCLHLLDNELFLPTHASLRAILLKSLYNIGAKLNLIPFSYGTLPQLGNFPLGGSAPVYSYETVESIMDHVKETGGERSSVIEGSFIAPIFRGFSADFGLPSILFGVPDLNQSTMTPCMKNLYRVEEGVHFFCQKNRICAAAGHVEGAIKEPFRIPSDLTRPPMSLSLASSNAETLSGTLGGYIYPMLGPDDPKREIYGDVAFAITCAHVCLTENKGVYPEVSVPSPVLVNAFRGIINSEASRYLPGTRERRAYERALRQIDTQYPLQNGRHKSPRPFGKVIWGERTIIDGSLSDVAVIKCTNGIKSDNSLGDDVAFSEYDPGLMFSNLSVRRIAERLVPGMSIFKYGSTSRFTTGRFNGPEVIYWADGTIQSSEFVVGGPNPFFASGGDSGAWLLQMPDEGEVGLTVVGMLHAFDGERREFGLFTPMRKILNRLSQITKVDWNVIGVPEKDEQGGGSDTSNEEGYPSGMED